MKSQLITCEHEGNWSKALEYYDLLVRFPAVQQPGSLAGKTLTTYLHFPHGEEDKMSNWKCYKGLMRSLQKTGCTHVLDTYGQGLTSQIGYLQNDSEFTELQVILCFCANYILLMKHTKWKNKIPDCLDFYVMTSYSLIVIFLFLFSVSRAV